MPIAIPPDLSQWHAYSELMERAVAAGRLAYAHRLEEELHRHLGHLDVVTLERRLDEHDRETVRCPACATAVELRLSNP